jgi:hypothetical protein
MYNTDLVNRHLAYTVVHGGSCDAKLANRCNNFNPFSTRRDDSFVGVPAKIQEDWLVFTLYKHAHDCIFGQCAEWNDSAYPG